jgi:hypothetical protein
MADGIIYYAGKTSSGGSTLAGVKFGSPQKEDVARRKFLWRICRKNNQ